MSFVETGRLWAQELTDRLVQLASQRADFSPPAYPFAVPDHYAALDVSPPPITRIRKTGGRGATSTL